MLVNVYLLLPLTRGRCKVHRKHLRKIRDGAYLYYLNAVIYSIVVIFHPPFSCEFPPLRCYVYVPVVIPLSYAILLVSRKGVAVGILCIICQGFRISFVKLWNNNKRFVKDKPLEFKATPRFESPTGFVAFIFFFCHPTNFVFIAQTIWTLAFWPGVIILVVVFAKLVA